jgi:hypothetical protein
VKDLWSGDDLVHQAFSNRFGGWYTHIGKRTCVVSLGVDIGSLPQLLWYVSTWWVSDFYDDHSRLGQLDGMACVYRFIS